MNQTEGIFTKPEERVQPDQKSLNLHCVNCGGISVHLTFTENGPTLNEALSRHLIRAERM